MNRSGIPTNIPHVSDNWLDDFHEHIRPDLFIEWTSIFDVGKDFFYSREYLLVKHAIRNYRQINYDLKNFFQIIAPWHSLFGKCFFDSISIECYNVDDIRKIGCQSDKPEHIPYLRYQQAIDVIEHDYDRFIQICQDLLYSDSILTNSCFLPLQEFTQTLRCNTGHPGKHTAIIVKGLAYFGETGADLQLSGEFVEEMLYELLRSTEHPRVEVEYVDIGLYKFSSGEIDKRSLP